MQIFDVPLPRGHLKFEPDLGLEFLDRERPLRHFFRDGESLPDPGDRGVENPLHHERTAGQMFGKFFQTLRHARLKSPDVFVRPGGGVEDARFYLERCPVRLSGEGDRV